MIRKATVPPAAYRWLQRIPDYFQDDGCSAAPDRLFRRDLNWACRIHDWWWCTRCHPKGSMTQSWRKAGDALLASFIRQALTDHPLRGLAYLAYRWGPWFGRNGFDTCGSEVGTYCRHNIPRPSWMRRDAREKLRLKLISQGEPQR